MKLLNVPQARYHCGNSLLEARSEREKLLDHIEYLQALLVQQEGLKKKE